MLHLVWNGDAEAAEVWEGVQEGLQVIHQQRQIHCVHARRAHRGIVQGRTPAVRDRIAYDPKHLRRHLSSS